MTYPQVQTSRILVNSLPKSGTHLLSKTMELLGYKDYFSHTGYDPQNPRFFTAREVKRALGEEGQAANEADRGEKFCIGPVAAYPLAVDTFQTWLAAVPYQRYVLGHIPWAEGLGDVLARQDYHHFFIIRDPRAVFVSRLRYILDPGAARDLYADRKHFLEEDLKAMAPVDRIEFLLEGGQAQDAGVTIRSYADAYRSALAWAQDYRCLLIRFEDLVGRQGGGSDEAQRHTIERIADHIGLDGDEDLSATLDKIYDPTARTFKSGKIDGWKKVLDPESLARLNAYCQPLCEEAGYAL
ncbi:MAG: sulfotransferase domain-containing protein [Prochlorothrix sp.]